MGVNDDEDAVRLRSDCRLLAVRGVGVKGTCLYVCMCVCEYVCMFVCVCVYVCMCVCICIFV